MLSKVLELHPNFPELHPNESKKENITSEGKTVTVAYSSKTEIIPYESETIMNTDTGETKWVEAGSAIYYITLKKIWNIQNGEIESYWKYKYDYQANEVTLVETENNDDS